MSSLGRSRAGRGLTTPSPLRLRSLLPHPHPSRNFAKTDSLVPASPVERRPAPHTPRGGAAYPDASRLSISHPPSSDSGSDPREGPRRNSMPPPVTPTAGRDHLHFAERVLVTPVNEKGSGLDIDTADYLLSAFESAECIGEGNHSKVYRVTVRKQVTSFL